MHREFYDKTNYLLSCGQIGRLMSAQCIPHVAGESLKIDIAGGFRLSPLRKALTLDARVDIHIFDVPHRHVYGSDWTDLLIQGHDSSVTLDTVSVSAANGPCGHIPIPTGTVPKAYAHGYAEIWNQYYRVPNGNTAELATNAVDMSGDNRRLYGQTCANLPCSWSRGVEDSSYQSDTHRTVDITAGTPDTFDLIDLDRVKAEFKSEVDRDFYARRYRDVMGRTFGADKVHVEADERPEMLAKSQFWCSGYDVDASDGANLGKFSGKASTMFNVQMPWKYFQEHGMIWIMVLVRFPSIGGEEIHQLTKKTWDYETISGDPAIAASYPPEELQVQDVTRTGDTTSLGWHPAYNYYRHQPNRVHPKYDNLAGYPVRNMDGANFDPWYYGTETLDYFSDTELRHWQINAKCNVQSKSPVPCAESSLYAGA